MENIWGFFPAGILALLRKAPAAKWPCVTWKMGKESTEAATLTWRVINSLPDKYISRCRDYFRVIPPHILTHLNIQYFRHSEVAMAWGPVSGLDCIAVCLFGRAQSCKLFAQQASSALWENSHMVVGEYDSMCVFIEKWLDTGRPAVRAQPLVPVSVTSLNNYNNVGSNWVKRRR